MEGERYCEGSNPRDKDMVKSDVLENVATTSPNMILPLVLCIKFSINYWLLTNTTFCLHCSLAADLDPAAAGGRAPGDDGEAAVPHRVLAEGNLLLG